MLEQLGFSGASVSGLLRVLMWVGIFALVVIIWLGIFILIMIKLKSISVFEIDWVTHRLRKMSGKFKKLKDGVEKLYVGKLRKHLSRVEQTDMYLQGKRDVVFLLKDKNGLHHTLRLPTVEQAKTILQTLFPDKPLTQGFDIFTMPNPHENLNWLSEQVISADKEFISSKWYLHPNFMVIGTAFICFMMFVITMLISRKI